MITRTHVAAAVAAVAAGSIALAAPTIGKAAFDSQNANKVDGYHAKQLNVVKFWTNNNVRDNFDTCDWTPMLKRSFVAPAKGTVTVQGVLTNETDFDFTDESIINTRLVLDGKAISQETELATDPEGGADRGNSPSLGGREVDKGKHKIQLQAEECGPGEAYVISRSVTLQFSPFGSAEKVPSSPVTVKAQPHQH
jgi:hypothetical protein